MCFRPKNGAPNFRAMLCCFPLISSGCGWPALVRRSGELEMTITNADLVTELYVGYFNRAPDTAGYAYWTHAVDAGMALSKSLTHNDYV